MRNDRGQFVKGHSGNPGGQRRDHADDDDGPIIRGTSGTRRADGNWYSGQTGIGTRQFDKRLSHIFGVGTLLSYHEIAALWERDAITAKAIEAPVQEAFRPGYEITTSGSGDYEKFKADLEDVLEELEFDAAVKRAHSLKRAFGGSAILIGANDHRPLDRPLDVANVRSVDYLNVLEPCEIRPVAIYNDISKGQFGKPQYFEIVNNTRINGILGGPPQPPPKIGTGQIIHASRLMVFRGVRASEARPTTTHQDISPFWGASVVHRFYEAMRDYGVAYAAASLLPIDISQPVISIEGLKEVIGKDNKKYLDRMQVLEMGRSVARVILIDAAREKFERQTTNLSNVPELLDRLSQFLSSQVGIPLSVLVGYSPASLGTPSGDEMTMWHNIVDVMRTDDLTPPMLKVIRMVARTLKERGLPKKIGLEWGDLTRMSTAERAEAELTQARTDSIDIKSGMATSDEKRRSRWVGGKYSFKTFVNEGQKAPGFIAPLPAGLVPKAISAESAIAAIEAGELGTSSTGAASPGAHAVKGYARKDPAAPVLGANPSVGGDKAPADNRDHRDAEARDAEAGTPEPYTAENELKHHRAAHARAKSHAARGVIAQLITITQQEAAACASGTCGPDCNYDHPAPAPQTAPQATSTSMDELDEYSVVEQLDRIAHRDGSWVVLSNDLGDVLAKFDNEVDAIHKLAQIAFLNRTYGSGISA